MEDAPEGYYLTDHLTDKAVDFIEKNSEGPFFLYLSHYGVHTPFEAKEEMIEDYRQKKQKMYPNDPEETFEQGEHTGETKVRQDNEIYAAMIESIDESLRRISDQLVASGLEKNTIIVFTSDHGGLSNRGNNRKLATTNAPLRAGKGHNYEGGIRVPMFIYWHNQIPTGESDTPVTGTDYFPTLLELAGLPLEENAHLDGVSFAGSLEDGSELNQDRPFFWHSPLPRPTSTGDRANTAIRLGDYKLLDFYEEGRIELYNLRKDISEENNIAESEPEITKKLLKMIRDWRNEIDAYMGKQS